MKTRFFILATLLAFTMPMCAQTETNEVIDNMMARRSIRKAYGHLQEGQS